ncbi:class I SAM-dependent methyltransferase [Agrilactobacillus fermenti]|uniref:class I SAM-dependent methyltransferase n=1 Tax=Agrilactobacillus fermenti TaxID=2586909 RepID=UPI003A5C73BE
MIYTTFASVYDRLMDEAMYDEWATYVNQSVLRETGVHPKLLELACGTGDLAVRLQQHGYQVTGLDISEEMLALADQKISEAQLKVPLIQGDMLDLGFPANFDVVTCFDDSLCYLRDSKAVAQTFSNVYRALKPGGIFLFDVHSLYQMDHIFPGYMYNAKFEDLAFMWSSYADDQRAHAVVHELTFFVWDEGIQGYQAIEEIHHERTYAVSDFKQLLTAAGFVNIVATADFGRTEIQSDSERYFFKCNKKN